MPRCSSGQQAFPCIALLQVTPALDPYNFSRRRSFQPHRRSPTNKILPMAAVSSCFANNWVGVKPFIIQGVIFKRFYPGDAKERFGSLSLKIFIKSSCLLLNTSATQRCCRVPEHHSLSWRDACLWGKFINTNFCIY